MAGKFTMPRFRPHDLRQFIQDILRSLGAPIDEASLVAHLLLDANLSGHDSHGVMQIPGYLEACAAGLIVPGTSTTCERDTAATALLDGHGGFGHKLAFEATQLALDKARLCGISAIGGHHCYHVGHLGVYVRQVAEAGMVGIMAVNDSGGGQRVVPYGGVSGRLSTNPLAVGLPTGDTAPFVLDMSTSMVAEGQIRLKRMRAERLPLGWMIDALGRPVTDPEDFFRQTGNLLPFGEEAGYKGYGLAIAIDALAGILGRAGHSRAPVPPYSNGMLIVVIDIGRFLPLEDFTAEVRDLITYLKSCPRSAGTAAILYPGEQAAQTRQRRLQDGIEIDPETWQQLQAIAHERGIQVPDSA
jgi:uncharacterized oxidoreductase